MRALCDSRQSSGKFETGGNSLPARVLTVIQRLKAQHFSNHNTNKS
jgi:hypothetical protein